MYRLWLTLPYPYVLSSLVNYHWGRCWPCSQDNIPPAYGEHPQDFSASPSIDISADPVARLKGKPTNFLCVDQRNGARKGIYILDPSLQIPDSHLSLPVKEGEWNNLYLHTRDGSVNVDVWLVGHKGDSKGACKWTSLHVSSNDRAIMTKVVRHPSCHSILQLECSQWFLDSMPLIPLIPSPWAYLQTMEESQFFYLGLSMDQSQWHPGMGAAHSPMICSRIALISAFPNVPCDILLGNTPQILHSRSGRVTRSRSRWKMVRSESGMLMRLLSHLCRLRVGVFLVGCSILDTWVFFMIALLWHGSMVIVLLLAVHT